MQRRTPERAVGWQLPAILWTAMAAGVLIKGPLILMFVVLTALTLSIADRSARWIWALRPARRLRLAGRCWCCRGSSPSSLSRAAVSSRSRSARTCWPRCSAARNRTARRRAIISLLFWVTFWPGSILAGLAAPSVWRARREPGAQFLLAWLMPSWIVFEVGDDQAAALCAAALSGDRHPDRRHPRARRARATGAGWCAAPSAGLSSRQ